MSNSRKRKQSERPKKLDAKKNLQEFKHFNNNGKQNRNQEQKREIPHLNLKQTVLRRLKSNPHRNKQFRILR